MKRIARLLAVLLAVCMLTAGAALTEGRVTFLLPIHYFCADDSQSASTQEQLDEHSKDGLLYEFTADGQIRCTVTDQAAALRAVILDMENTFAGAQDPNGSMYAKSFLTLEHNADLSEITVVCNKKDWGFLDSFYGMFFLANARDYQLYSGVPANELKSLVRFVDEGGEVLYTDDLAEYLNAEAEEADAAVGEEPAAGPAEPSSAGDGKMPYDQVLRLIKWVDDGYFRNKTYEEFVAFTGVDGLDQGHKDTSMTALGNHYFDWIADSDPTHYIHVCFRGRDESGRFEANQWNTSGFRSEEWAEADLTDWLAASACHDTAETALEIQRFSNPLVTVTAQMPVAGWNTRVNGNTAYFYNERGEQNNDPRIEVITYDDPGMFDFYLEQYENVQPAAARVIAGVEMQGRTYHAGGWDWTEYSAQLSEKVSVCVRISRVNCGAGTEGGALLDSLHFSWTEADGTACAFPGSVPLSAATAQPEPEVTAEPVPVVTETPAPAATEAPALTDEFAPNDPIELAAAVSDRPASWQEYAFINELNGITLTFCVPMDADTVTNFYANKEPTFNQNNGRAAFHWKYDTAEKTGMRIDITQLYPTDKAHEIRSLMGHNADGNTYTTLKTDRGMTIYRKVSDRGEARWAIVSDPLSDGSRVLALVEAANSGKPGEPWYEAIMQAFEGTVRLIIPGEQPGTGSAQPAATETPAAPVPVTEAPAPAAETPAAAATPLPAVTAGSADYAGTWYSTWMKAGGMDSDPRSQFGLTIVLTLNEDGTGDFDYFGSDGGGIWGADEEGTVRYWGDGTALSLLEDGSLCWGSYLSGYILFSRDRDAEARVFPADPAAQSASAPDPAADTAADTSGTGIPVGVKYVAKTYTAAGVTLDASAMGGEYAIRLDDDGTAAFTMAGTSVPGYSWRQADDRVEVGAYGSVVMTLTMQADGSVLLDYGGSFTMLMAAAQ